jgi:hypothetical protein
VGRRRFLWETTRVFPGGAHPPLPHESDAVCNLCPVFLLWRAQRLIGHIECSQHSRYTVSAGICFRGAKCVYCIAASRTRTVRGSAGKCAQQNS